VLDKADYCDAFHREANMLADAARQGLDAAVPSCPGWSVASLLTHLIADVYAPRIRQLQEAPIDPPLGTYADLGLPSRFQAWTESDRTDLALLPEGLVDLYSQTASSLEAGLRAAEPELPVRTWWPPQQNAGFLQRRMTLETAVHRWDVQLAHGQPRDIESALAADGIDEAVDIMLTRRRSRQPDARQGAGESYHLHRTDGTGEWLIRFKAEGPVVSREHAKGDIALRGTASDLLLFLWHRIPASRLEVFGDVTLVDRFFELAPPN
jgi:uncharacterized protein (TIGR03083 family)